MLPTRDSLYGKGHTQIENEGMGIDISHKQKWQADGRYNSHQPKQTLINRKRYEEMERYSLFLDWKNQIVENDYTVQSNLQTQCNP